MKSSRNRRLALATTALAATMTIGVPPASAQGLLELLFGTPEQLHRPAEPTQQQAPEPQRTQPASLPRVAGPSYYDYRADPLVRVDFAAIEIKIEEARAPYASGLMVASAEGIDPQIVASVERLAAEASEDLAADEGMEQAEAVVVAEDEEVSAPQAAAVPDVRDAAPLQVETAVAEGDDAAEQVAETAPEVMPSDVGTAAQIAFEAEVEAAIEQADTAADEVSEIVEESAEAVAEMIEDGVEDVAEAAEEAAGAVETAVDDGVAAEVETVREEISEEVEEVAEIIEEIAPEPMRLTEATLEALQEFDLMTEKAVAEALVAHYSEHPDFIWVLDGVPSEAAVQAMDVLAAADSHGLNPDHYRVSTPRRGASEAELARFEMELSARTLRYVRDVHGGRIDPNRISGYYDFQLKEVDFAVELATLAEADDVRAHLDSRHPQNEFYQKLRAELEMLRVSEENDIVIDLQGLIRPGNTNAEFAKILKLIERDADAAFLEEHGEVLARHRGSDVYDQELVPVIRGAQAARNLAVDGVIGPQTVRGLAGESVAGRKEKVILALEQMRWLPSDLTDRFVFLNAPSFRAQYFENGVEKLNMRAIYGNTGRQTYFFKDRVSYVEFHPFWGVPRSILVNTYLSRLIDDPGYLDRSGFEVTDRNGRSVPSSAIDWGRYGANIPYDVRQRPGPRNALGELKIMFPNRHAIYMHDTPDRHLFDRVNRAISNGCIRLEDPRAMAAAVLGWDVSDVSQRLQRPHSREDLQVEVPVYVAYFTAFPEASGKIAYYDDVYSRDPRLAQAIERLERARTPSS
ncbi:MAG: L,D-transpeptidase family protein [Aliihoeflea sp.]